MTSTLIYRLPDPCPEIPFESSEVQQMAEILLYLILQTKTLVVLGTCADVNQMMAPRVLTDGTHTLIIQRGNCDTA